MGQDKIVIGFVGSFAFWHGVELLVGVIPDIVKSVPNVHFLLIGSGECLQDVKNGVAPKGLNRHITFTGKISPERVPLYLKAMDIGVIPNSNVYGSPVKLFEYMAMGKPVIATKLPGVMMEFGKNNGIIFVDKPKDVVEKAIDIIEANKLLTLGAKARKCVEKYDWNHIACTFEKHLKTLIN